MSYERVNWANKGEVGSKRINKTNLNHMDEGIEELDLKKIEISKLVAVSETAPTVFEENDQYYNLIDKNIYTAIDNKTWSPRGEDPATNKLYVDLSESKLYYYDGIDFKSYGGGTGGGETLPVGSEIEFNGEERDIPTGWNKESNVGDYILATTTTESTASTNLTVLLNSVSEYKGNSLILTNNSIVIGEGVSKIKVSGNIFMNSPGASGYVWCQIQKNNSCMAGTLISSASGVDYLSSPVPSSIFSVKEGDKITLYANCTTAGKVRTGVANTWLLVEVID